MRRICIIISIFLFGSLTSCGSTSEKIEEKKEPIKKEEEIKEVEKINPDFKKIEGLSYNIIGDSKAGKDILFKNKYTDLEGVTTFRGNNYRDGGSFGHANVEDKSFKEAWKFTTSSSTWGGGAGWTGQPAIVKWPKDIKREMNIKKEFKEKEDFTEVIYASLDGSVYFLDLETGKESRERIRVGNPIKGSLSVDPRGLPILYVGEGINEKGLVGFNMYSLLDGEKLYEVSGSDGDAYRGWPAFDSSSIIHGETDTVILGGENGMLYLIKLNSKFDKNKISINPKITKYRYKIKNSEGRLGIENSVAIYGNLVYFADNNGDIQCVDLNTLKPVWLVKGGDDIDASLTIEVENETPYVYCGTEVDHQGSKGKSEVRKINGLNGEVKWKRDFECESIIGDHAVNGGLLATNVIGKKDLKDMVIFSEARYKGFNKGSVIALDKKDGKTLWETSLPNYMWSSPVAIYDEKGKGYIIQGDSSGYLYLLDGKTGEILNKTILSGNIESTPTIFNDTLVVATRNGIIHGVKIE